MPFEALPAVDPEPHAREVQLRERAAWMGRDMSQADLVRDMCNKLGETVSLIDANNAGPQ